MFYFCYNCKSFYSWFFWPSNKFISISNFDIFSFNYDIFYSLTSSVSDLFIVFGLFVGFFEVLVELLAIIVLLGLNIKDSFKVFSALMFEELLFSAVSWLRLILFDVVEFNFVFCYYVWFIFYSPYFTVCLLSIDGYLLFTLFYPEIYGEVFFLF